MTNDIIEAMNRNLEDLGRSQKLTPEFPIYTSHTKARILKVTNILDDLKIEHPPLRGIGVVEMWRRFLPSLLAAAETGKLKKARLLWQQLQCIMTNPDD